MSLGDCRTSVLSILNRRDCKPALADEFLTQGLRRVQRNLRIPSMERAMLVTADVVPVESFEAPVDLLEIIDLMVGDGKVTLPLEKKSWRQIMSMGRQVGQSRFYARVGASLNLYPYMPVGSTATLIYYGSFQPLVNDTDENEITRAAPDLLTYASLSFAGDHFQMDQKDAWEARYGSILAEVQDEATQLDTVGGPSVVVPPHGDY